MFLGEAGVNSEDDNIKQKNILEIKWKSVARLKKQVLALEDQIKRYREENDVNAIMGSQKEGLPKQPERYKLQGHKNKITKVAFHPIHDLLASASEDSSIKLWDSESGEIEKTLKGHTSKVN
jgi:platelet-activating factor acetylhydrolase IB subunit alpha